MAKHNRTRRTVRQSRALGIALTPKAEKYLERRPYGPGQYNIREAQMRRAYLEAKRTEGQTGKNMVELLETRLDALVLRAGFARTIAQARQMVVHRHIMVDGVRVDRPSFHVKPGQLIHVHPKAEKTTPFQAAAAGENQAVLPEVPAYLNVEIEKLHAKLERKPKREEIPVICDEQLVVEYYSRLA